MTTIILGFFGYRPPSSGADADPFKGTPLAKHDPIQFKNFTLTIGNRSYGWMEQNGHCAFMGYARIHRLVI